MIANPKLIVIIGNGFDLNLGLKTAYSDFIESRFFQDLLGKNLLCKHLNNIHGLQNWIDIENELKVYSKSNNDNNFENNFDELCLSLMNYLDILDYSLISLQSRAYETLEKIRGKEFLIVDFNYTKSTEIILERFGYSVEEINDRLIKIHGSIKNRQIIFGIEDGARIDRNHVFLKKSYNNNFKTINFKNLFEDASNIIFFGHSLGETDHMYFADFFMMAAMQQKNKNIYLFHYGKKGYKQLFMQLDDLTNHNLSKFKQNNTLQTIDTIPTDKIGL